MENASETTKSTKLPKSDCSTKSEGKISSQLTNNVTNCPDLIQMDRSNIRQSITAYFRDLIQNGKLSPGDKLPSTHLLAKNFDTGVANVQRALTILVQEGLISRVPRHGSIVQEKSRELRSVGIYQYFNPTIPPRDFQRILTSYMQIALVNRGISARLYHDSERPYSFKNVYAAYERREFDALFFPEITSELAHKYHQLKIPHLTMSDKEILFTSSGFAMTKLFPLAIQALKQTGGKNIAVISSINDPRTNPQKRLIQSTRVQLYDLLEAEAERAGLILAGENIITPQRALFPSNQEYELFGYESFRKLWLGQNRPDSLFLFPDDSFPGLLAALYEFNVRVPEELKLVIHHNLEKQLLCPFDCIFVEISIAEFAECVIDALVNRFYRHDIKLKEVLYRIKQHYHRITDNQLVRDNDADYFH